MTYLALFFSGVFLCNAIPHLAAGLLGQRFPTPFAKPRGIGLSSPVVNFAWGSLNLAGGMVLLDGHPVPGAFTPQSGALVVGFLALGFHCSRHFGRVRDGRL